jgi:hypothetical protein
MSGGLEAVVAQLLDVRDRIASSAVTAMRARADADQALAHYREASQGSDHPEMKQALADLAIAGDKAAKIGRILGEALEHFTNYLDRIAPGSPDKDDKLPAADMPTGEELVREAERRGRRADVAWRKQVQRADDMEDSLKSAEAGGKSVLNYFKRQQDPPGSTGAGTTTASPSPAQQHAQVEHPLTAVIMAASALAVVTRSVWHHVRNQRLRKRDPDDRT